MFLQHRWTAVVLGWLAALWLAPVPSRAADNTATVRVVHAAPAAAALDFYVDGSPALEGVEFFTVSRYINLPAGEHLFQVVPSGQSTSGAIISATLPLTPEQPYTIVATGRAGDEQLVFFQEDLSAPPVGRVKLRVIHLALDTAAIDLRAGAAPVASQVAFRSASEYVTIDPGEYQFSLALSSISSVELRRVTARLDADGLYDLFAVGTDGQVDARIVALPRPAQASGQSAVLNVGPALVGVAGALALLAGAALLWRRRARHEQPEPVSRE